MRHMMLDTETWGTRPGSAVRSIGAAMFDPMREGAVGRTFYVNVDDKSQEEIGLTRDQGTVDWWSKQSQIAQDALGVDQKPVREAVGAFTQFFQSTGAQFVWSQGGNFDDPIMCAIYRALGAQAPWKFWNSRCTRTAYDMAGVNFNAHKRQGTHHNALDDSLHQIKLVQLSYRILRGPQTQGRL